MTTDYDPIAEQYQRSKQQPWRTHIEAFSLLNQIGDPAGKQILDIACGEGFYTRLLRKNGATRVLGVDLSQGMIDLAQQQEREQKLGVEYLVADARELPVSQQFDIAVAAYLLNYSRTPHELQAMCYGIARALKPGGRFVTVNSSPMLHFPRAPSFRKYEFETKAESGWEEGAPIQWIFHLSDGSFEIENYYLSQHTHEQAFRSAGFSEVHWHAPQLSASGIEEYGADFWNDFLKFSPITLIECVKSHHENDHA